MPQVVVTFDVANREEAAELEAGIRQTLAEHSPGGGRLAPWIPGAVLRNVTGWEVNYEREEPVKIYVYGSSDDLIEVEGDLRDEFNGDAGVLTLSDGTALHVEYVDGIWEVEVQQAGTLTTTKHPPVSEDDGPRRIAPGEFNGMTAYSEILVLEGEHDGPLTASWRQA